MGVRGPRRWRKAERRNPVLVRLPHLLSESQLLLGVRVGEGSFGHPAASTQTPLPPGTAGCPRAHVCVFTRMKAEKKAQGSHRTPGFPLRSSPSPHHPQPRSTWGDPVGSSRWHGSAAQYPWAGPQGTGLQGREGPRATPHCCPLEPEVAICWWGQGLDWLASGVRAQTRIGSGAWAKVGPRSPPRLGSCHTPHCLCRVWVSQPQVGANSDSHASRPGAPRDSARPQGCPQQGALPPNHTASVGH